VDLSSLWAGPLCASLFSNLGARVVKVETFQRPDGARNGNSTFYDLLNEGKDSIVLNFANAGEVAALIRLLLSADIVVDSSRPRALHSLGIQAEEIVRRRRGQTWISITGHGRLEPHGNRAGFGDDCAVEAGLSWLMERAYGLPLFCGDAISDPLTGLHAALAGWACFQKGGGSVVSLALTDVVAHCIAAAPSDDLAARQRIWNTIGGGFEDERYPLRRPRNVAAGIGQHTDQVLAELAC
jgi:crotonobetainyl-CoA:carnitine CoA-transferase CaiB-like acyl-CoA transferase